MDLLPSFFWTQEKFSPHRLTGERLPKKGCILYIINDLKMGGGWLLLNTVLYISATLGNSVFHSLALCSFALFALLKRASKANSSCPSLQKKWGSKSLPLLFLKEQLEPNEWIAFFDFSNTRVIRSLWKRDSLFFKRGLCSFLKGKLFGFAFIKKKKEWIALITLYRSSDSHLSVFTKRAKRAICSFL